MLSCFNEFRNRKNMLQAVNASISNHEQALKKIYFFVIFQNPNAIRPTVMLSVSR